MVVGCFFFRPFFANMLIFRRPSARLTPHPAPRWTHYPPPRPFFFFFIPSITFPPPLQPFFLAFCSTSSASGVTSSPSPILFFYIARVADFAPFSSFFRFFFSVPPFSVLVLSLRSNKFLLRAVLRCFRGSKSFSLPPCFEPLRGGLELSPTFYCPVRP